jgi:hypothetical protein
VISLETGDAVDDLRCELADGSAMHLQAKRTCGADRNLESTVGQWIRQLPDLQPGDRIGLVTAHPQGSVRILGAALSRRHRPHPGPPTAELRALDAVRERLPPGTPPAAGEAVLDVALVMTVAAETEQDPDFRHAAALLDATVVPVGSGSAAIRALQRAFQEQAAAGTGSGVDEWLQTLADAGLEVFADAEGPAGPRRRAELDAVAGYRRRLAERDGWLEFSLLADDLPPMRYGPLADTFRISVAYEAGPPRDDRLLDTARRWPLMLLTGLPGMGKSTALEQFAARWAADPRAPVPILVPLLEIARRHPRRGSDITLDLLLEVAALTVPAAERAPLRSVLRDAVARGEAVLLLDGLDECRELRGVVADGLTAITAELPSDTGVLLTTRDSGLAASGKLGFPQAHLTEPSFLGVAAGMLLRHAAQHRVPEPERDRWVGQRERWLAEIRKDHSDLWRIPLLAMLFTLLAAGRGPRRLPGSRAQLLAEVVHDSVARWELARPTPTPGSQADSMRPEMLTEGFAEIGHALAAAESCAPGNVRRAVAGMLASRWGLASGEADARAGDVLSFWDDQVGVFVSVPPTGEIEARSRVFSEIADAMWATRQDLDTQRVWVGAALGDEDRREPLLLAAGLSDQVAEILAAEAVGAADGQAQALLLAADAAHDGAVLAPETTAAVLAALVDMAGRPPAGKWPDDYRDLPGEASLPNYRGRQDGPDDAAWTYVRRAAMLRLPGSLRDERRSLLAGLQLAGDQALVAGALAALADAAADSRATLLADEAAAVGELLDTAISADRRDLLPGQINAADQAITYLRQLGPGAPAAIYRIARHGSIRGYRRVEEQLTALGFTDADAQETSVRLAAPVIGIPDPGDDWDTLFEAAAAASPPTPLTAAEQWRLPDLATLSDVLDPLEATLVSIDAAFTTDRERLPGWIRATARAAGIDLPGLAGQAAAALATWQAGDRAVADVMLAPPLPPPPPCDIIRLGQDDITVLIDTLGVTSEWLADVACALLLTGRDPAIGQRVAELLPSLSAGRRRNAAVVVIANDPDPAGAAQRMLDSTDPPARVAAAIATGILAGRGSSESWAAVIARALADDDLTVRLACQEEVGREDAVFWSCPRCAYINDIEATGCAACGRGRGQRDLRLPRLAQLLCRPAV